MKKIVFITIALSLFFIHAFAGKHNNEEPFLIQKFPTSSITNVDVKTDIGNVKIDGDATNEAEVKVFIRRCNSDDQVAKEEIEELLNDNYEIEIKVEKGTLFAYAKKKKSNIKKELSIGFEISVGSKVDGQVKTSVGSINVQNIQGKIKGNSGTGSVKIEKCNGDINLKTGVGSISLSELKGTVEISSGSGSIKAEDIAANLTVKTSIGSMQFKNISGSLNGSTGNGSVHLENIQNDAELATNIGSISAKKCSGKLKLNSNSGSIKLKEIDGNINVATSIGSLTLTDLTGDINVQTNSGSIQANNLKGEIILGTSIGSFTAKNISGNLDAKTGTGSVSIEMTNIEKHLRLNTSSMGNIKVVLPKDKGYDLKVKGGKIKSLKNFKGIFETGNIDGEIGNGGAEVSITANGNNNIEFSLK